MKTKFVEGDGTLNDCRRCCLSNSTKCPKSKCFDSEREDGKEGYFVEVKEPKKLSCETCDKSPYECSHECLKGYRFDEDTETILTIPKRPLIYTFLFALVITLICSDLFPVRWPYLVIGAVGLSVVSLVAVMRVKLPKMWG